VGSQYVIIARSLVTWRSIVVIKISIKETLLKNITRSNVYSMLIKNLQVGKEIGTWTVDAAITWSKIKASSKTLINLSMSKFDLETVPQWNLKVEELSWWRQRKVRNSSRTFY